MMTTGRDAPIDNRTMAKLAEDGARAVEATGEALVFEEAPPTEKRHIADRRVRERRLDALLMRGGPDDWVYPDFCAYDTPSSKVRDANGRPEKNGSGDWLDSLSSDQRKEIAIAEAFFAYFPDAIGLVARWSMRANEKHNPGQPVHWARGKSNDHESCIARHSIAVAVDPDSFDGPERHIICRAWRAMAALQEWAERKMARKEKI